MVEAVIKPGHYTVLQFFAQTPPFSKPSDLICGGKSLDKFRLRNVPCSKVYGGVVSYCVRSGCALSHADEGKVSAIDRSTSVHLGKQRRIDVFHQNAPDTLLKFL